MEGTTEKVPNKKGANPEDVDIDTSNILFIVGGAFVGIENVVMQRLGKSKIGFKETNKSELAWEDNLETQDLVKYGLIPEFLGRLPSVNVLHELNKEDLTKVLTEPKNSLIKQYQALFELDKIDLEFNIRGIDAVVDIAIEQELGARGLRKIIDNALIDVQYELPELAAKGVKKIVVSEETIRHGRKPHMIKGSIN